MGFIGKWTRIACPLLFAFLAVASPALLAATLEEGVEQYEAKNYQKAVEILLPLANNGNPEAQRRIGEMCYDGQGFPKNLEAAFKWNLLAAKGGDRVAMYNLGYLYERGEGVTANRDTAVDWYLKSSVQNYAEAQFRLGQLFEKTDRTMAVSFYEKAYSQGHAQAGDRYHAISDAIAKQQATEAAADAQKRADQYAREAPVREARKAEKRWEEQEKLLASRERRELRRLQEIEDEEKHARDEADRQEQAQNIANAIQSLGTAYTMRARTQQNIEAIRQVNTNQPGSSAALAGTGRSGDQGNSTVADPYRDCFQHCQYTPDGGYKFSSTSPPLIGARCEPVPSVSAYKDTITWECVYQIHSENEVARCPVVANSSGSSVGAIVGYSGMFANYRAKTITYCNDASHPQPMW